MPSGVIDGFGLLDVRVKWVVDWIAWRARESRFGLDWDAATKVDIAAVSGIARLAVDCDGDDALTDGGVELDSVSSATVSLSPRTVETAASPVSSFVSAPANCGNWVEMISSCSRTKLAFNWTFPKPALARLLVRRGILRSLGISRSSRGGARSMAAKRDWSQRTKVSILLQERRNWSASARTRITKRFLGMVSEILGLILRLRIFHPNPDATGNVLQEVLTSDNQQRYPHLHAEGYSSSRTVPS